MKILILFITITFLSFLSLTTVKSESVVDSIDLNYFFCKQQCSDSCPSYPMKGDEPLFIRNNIHVTEDRFNGDMFVYFRYNAANKTVYVQGNQDNNPGYDISSFQYPIVNPSNIENENCIVIINNRSELNNCFGFVVCNNSFSLSPSTITKLIIFSIISIIITFII